MLLKSEWAGPEGRACHQCLAWWSRVVDIECFWIPKQSCFLFSSGHEPEQRYIDEDRHLKQEISDKDPISAKKGTNITILVGEIILALPERPPLYPENLKTDFPRELWIGEVIREKIFQMTYHEIPYATLVKVESIEDKGKILHIQATIYTEEPSQKGIIIGKGAKKLKEIGIRARKDLESFFHKKVYLELEVKVEKGWRRKGILSGILKSI